MALKANMTLAESRLRLVGGIFTLIASAGLIVLPAIYAPEQALYGYIAGGVALLGGLFMLFEYKKRWCVAKAILGKELPEGAECAISPGAKQDAE